MVVEIILFHFNINFVTACGFIGNISNNFLETNDFVHCYEKKCVFINYSPYYKWIDAKTNAHNIGVHLSINTNQHLDVDSNGEYIEIDIKETHSDPREIHPAVAGIISFVV